jgi:hypothetical protein
MGGATRIRHFVGHFLEMCAPMCVGFAVGDVVYFWLAGAAGYTEPFSELPELSVLVVTVSMTAPMAAWMRFRRMPIRAVTEMSVVMPFLALVLLVLGWGAFVPMGELALLEHGLMMPAMLVPMLFRLDLYTEPHRHRLGAHRSEARRRPRPASSDAPPQPGRAARPARRASRIA